MPAGGYAADGGCGMIRRWYLVPELYDREQLLELLRSGMSVREIGEQVGCTRTMVLTAMKNHGIVRPFVREVPETLRRRLRL